MNNTQLQKIKKLLQRSQVIIEHFYNSGDLKYSSWLKDADPVIKELEALGAENLQKPPEGYEWTGRRPYCPADQICSTTFLEEHAGCDCLKPITQAAAQPEQVAPPLNSSGSAKEENNGGKFTLDEKVKWLHSMLSLDSFEFPGHIVHAIVGDLQKLYTVIPRPKEPIPPSPSKGLWTRLRDMEIDYRNCQVSNAKLEKEMEAMKGGGLAASWRGRIRSLEKQMVATDKEIANLRGTTEANVKVLQEYVGKSKMLNDLRKEVNELLAEKNNYVQRFESLEDLLNRQVSRIDSQHRLITKAFQDIETSPIKVILEEIINKLRTL